MTWVTCGGSLHILTRRQTIVLAGKEFRTKGEKEECLHNILFGHFPGKHLVGEEFDTVLANTIMLDKVTKEDNIIDIIIEAGLGSEHHFLGVRSDGTKVRFGYHESPSNYSKFTSACRHVFDEDKYEMIRRADMTGLELHHCLPWPFVRIVDWFIGHYRIDVDKVIILKNTDRVRVFTDIKLAELFRQYHNERGVFRLVTKAENLRLKSEVIELSTFLKGVSRKS